MTIALSTQTTAGSAGAPAGYLLVSGIFLIFVTFGILFAYMIWERRRDLARIDRETATKAAEELERREEERRTSEIRARELETLLAHQQERLEDMLQSQVLARREFEEKTAAGTAAANSVPGSGGYIVVEMPEKDRSLFHDLLKGFEDYAKLKGYQISFSIDSSLVGRIAFKFTVKNHGVVIGPERVRADFREYVENVRNGSIEDLDQMPAISSFEEHNLLVTMLKNRITFIHHSYQLTQNALHFYENLLLNLKSFPALPAPTVIVHTGGNMDSRSYNAVHSERIVQGDKSELVDSSTNIEIGNSFNQRQERISALDETIQRIEPLTPGNANLRQAEHELRKVREELTEEIEPDRPKIRKWLESAKNLLGSAALGFEIVESARKLWEMFGI